MSEQNAPEVSGTLTPVVRQLSWRCVGHNPTRWSCGIVESGNLISIAAQVTRLKEGRWAWQTFEPADKGVEPSRITAIDAAERVLSNTKDEIRRQTPPEGAK